MRGLRRIRVPFLGCAAFLGVAVAQASAQPSATPRFQPTEIEVKAAFLYHFAQLIAWPDVPSPDPSAPMVIAVIGADPFGERLEATIGAETVRGRAIKIVRASTFSELSETPAILVLGPMDRVEASRALGAASKAPVLTVSSARGFARGGGMIEFRITPDGRVAFDINVQAASAAGLKMSSQLLKLARIVESSR